MVRAACGVYRMILKHRHPSYSILLRGRQCSRQIERMKPSNFVYPVISGVARAGNPFLRVAICRTASQRPTAVDVAAGRPQCKNMEEEGQQDE